MASNLRCVPLLFAVGVTAGTMEAINVIINVFRAGDDRFRFMVVVSNAWFVNSLLLGAAALPLVAYLVSLSYYLMLDGLSAIVSIPGKIDGLGRGNAESGQAEP